MSRDLLVIAAIALMCILISPFYKEKRLIHTNDSPMLDVKSKTLTISRHTTIKTSNPKSIILMTDSFLPATVAGSEISAYETIKYLRARGHTVSIYVKKYSVVRYDNFPIYKYEPTNEICRNSIINSDVVLFQMSIGQERKSHESFEVVQLRKKPTYIFIHLMDSYDWLLQQKVGFPVIIVYNSRIIQDSLPTHYDNMRMIPYVDINKLIPNREFTRQNDVVTLINCNHNKGGDILIEIAKKLPNVQFLGIKGGYSNQLIESNKLANLEYMENQKDINVVLRKTGILIMPSKNETWGRTAVEAMASGIPVIHSQTPGLVECVGGAGIQCDQNDIDAWCQAIQHIIGDRAYREQLRQYGFKRVKEIEAEQVRGRQELALKMELQD